MRLIPIELTVNGEVMTDHVAPMTTLANFLRKQLGLTGTHLGCEEGVCGSCTVLMDGRTTRSCLTLAAQAQGRHVMTVEGYADKPELRRLQEAFVDGFAAQCGFCTAGMMAVVAEFLDDINDGDRVSEKMIRDRLNACACRCTGYQFIVEVATRLAKERMSGRSI